MNPDSNIPVNQSPIPPMQQMAVEPQGFQPSEANDEKKEKAKKRIEWYGIVCLILGCIVLIGYVILCILFRTENPALAVIYMVYHFIYGCVFLSSLIVCVILFFLALNDMVKHKIKFSKFVIMSIVGVVLTFSPLIHNGINWLSWNNDSYVAKGGSSTGNSCQSFAERAEYDYYERPSDIMCAYLEAFYRSGKEPKTEQDIMPYINSGGVKNGDIKVTIDAEQPKARKHYNIVTRHSCNYHKGEDKSYISVWYYDSDGKMEYKCDDIHAYSGSDLYDLESSKEWFTRQFDAEEEE